MTVIGIVAVVAYRLADMMMRDGGVVVHLLDVVVVAGTTHNSSVRKQ